MTAKHATRGATRSDAGVRVNAVLGPTNTGKTHFALERMLAHRSGMMGLPLRLLAREIFDKVVRIKGAQVVALVTGEEKIVPAQARYFVCTVEAMPVDLRTDFLAVDEFSFPPTWNADMCSPTGSSMHEASTRRSSSVRKRCAA